MNIFEKNTVMSQPEEPIDPNPYPVTDPIPDPLPDDPIPDDPLPDPFPEPNPEPEPFPGPPEPIPVLPPNVVFQGLFFN